MRYKDIFCIDSAKTAEIGILIPVYNQDVNISRVLESLTLNVCYQSDLLIIDDCSTDDTVQEVIKYLKLNKTELVEKFNKILLIKNKKSYFETHCDYYGIEILRNRFVIEIQSDMIITEKFFDVKMVKALTAYQDVLAVSGRGTHQITPVMNIYRKSLGAEQSYSKSLMHHIINRIFYQVKRILRLVVRRKTLQIVSNEAIEYFDIHNELTFLRTGEAGRLGDLINLEQNKINLSANKMYLGQTVMRGPLIIDSEKYFEVGGFNKDYFFQGFDDHELFLKAWLDKKYRVGYVPVGFSSPLSIGTGRKPRSLKSEISFFLNLLRIRYFRSATLLSLSTNLDESDFPTPQIRII